MRPSDAAFALLAANPIGGLLIAIPYAVFKLKYPFWLIVVEGAPLAYLQVIAVDLAWEALSRAAWWRDLLEKRRNRWAERLMASRGGFWITFAATPIIGPWVVMAFMRYARVPHRRVFLPISLALAASAVGICAACIWIPKAFTR